MNVLYFLDSEYIFFIMWGWDTNSLIFNIFLLIFHLILYTMEYNLLLWILNFLIVLFMVLRDDTINQTMLVHIDLMKLIPKYYPGYFIKNVVDQIDCSEANRVFVDSPGEFAYPRELLFRLILMSVFDGRLSSREIERRTQTGIGYMYLAGMQHPSYCTIL